VMHIPTERRFRYLYLAVACFVGVMGTFFVDGYMGVYDTLYITAGKQEQKIELYQWLKGNGSWSSGAPWGERAVFRCEINNREFSSYSTNIEVSLWQNQEKVRDLTSRHLQITSFGRGELEWLVDTVELEPGGAPPATQPYKYSIVIKGDEMERELNFYIYMQHLRLGS